MSGHELSKHLPREIKLNLYSAMKQQEGQKKKVQVRLQESLEMSHNYFDQIRQMWQGADDNYKGNYIEYFKECHAHDINPIPMLFKCLR